MSEDYVDRSDVIIRIISQTNYMNLQTLLLRGNKISSIELLQFINMPLLTELDLSNNSITKVSSLNKCAWDSLRKISLDLNVFQEIDLARMKIFVKIHKINADSTSFNLENKQMTQISLYFIEHRLAHLAKLTFNNFQDECINMNGGNFEINEKQRLKKSLLRKFPCAKF